MSEHEPEKHLAPDASSCDFSAKSPCIYAAISRDALNSLWARYASRQSTQVTERVRYYRATENGTWQAGAIHIGSAQMHYGQRDATVSKRLLQETVFTLKKERGELGRRIQEMRETWPPAQTSLSINIELAESWLRYQMIETDALQLHWAGQASYEHSGGDYSWSALTEYYDRQKSTRLYAMPRPQNSALADMRGDFVDRAGLLDIHFNPCGGPGRASAPVAPPAVSTDQTFSLSFLAVYFPEITIEGQPPYDRHWACELAVPPMTVSFDYGAYWEALGYYLASYEPLGSRQALGASAQAEVPLSITPMLRVVGAGTPRQTLTLEPSGVTGQWAFAGSAVGTLGNESGQWFYQPPAVANPAATLKADNKTNVPAVVRSTLAFPVAADVINASAGARSATSTFVTVYAQETHYFKARLSSGQVQLTLCYKDRSNNEVQVPATNTRWTVKAGNGTVSATGIFTPASSQPTPFTVLMAEDVDTMLLYWAYIVLALPTLEPEKVVEYING